MVHPITGPGGLDSLGRVAETQPAEGASSAGGKDFKQILLDSLDEVNRLQGEADRRVEALYRGDTDNVAEVFTAVNKAGIAFDLLMEMRNKLLEAYHEIEQIRIYEQGLTVARANQWWIADFGLRMGGALTEGPRRRRRFWTLDPQTDN